jgi:hypothetical protein
MLVRQSGANGAQDGQAADARVKHADGALKSVVHR